MENPMGDMEIKEVNPGRRGGKSTHIPQKRNNFLVVEKNLDTRGRLRSTETLGPILNLEEGRRSRQEPRIRAQEHTQVFSIATNSKRSPLSEAPS